MQLIVYDSFEGLPPPTPGDQYAKPEATGLLRSGPRRSSRRTCARSARSTAARFRKGWFSDTLPHHTEPVVLVVPRRRLPGRASTTASAYLWPKLTDQGYVFIDEYVLPDYCALFWSERYWRTRFDRHPARPDRLRQRHRDRRVLPGAVRLGKRPHEHRLHAQGHVRLLGLLPGRGGGRGDRGRVGCRRLRVPREGPHLNRQVRVVAKPMPGPQRRPSAEIPDHALSVAPRLDAVHLQARALEQGANPRGVKRQ